LKNFLCEISVAVVTSACVSVIAYFREKQLRKEREEAQQLLEIRYKADCIGMLNRRIARREEAAKAAAMRGCFELAAYFETQIEDDRKELATYV
jgi:hypothetical protein